MAAQRNPHYMSIEEWRELERANPEAKYEYIDGQVYFISGGSLAHARIGSNAVQGMSGHYICLAQAIC